MWSDLLQHIINVQKTKLESDTARISKFLLEHTLDKQKIIEFSNVLLDDLESFNDVAIDILYDFFTSWAHVDDLFDGESLFILHMIFSTFMNKEDYTIVFDYGYFSDFCYYDYEKGKRVIITEADYDRKLNKAINSILFDFVDIPRVLEEHDNDFHEAISELEYYDYTIAYIRFKNKGLGRKLRKNPMFGTLIDDIGMVMENGIPMMCLARNIEYDPYNPICSSLKDIMASIKRIRKDLGITKINEIEDPVMKKLFEHDEYYENNPYSPLFNRLMDKKESKELILL